MLTIVRDPLLTAAKVIIIVIMVLLGIAAGGLLVGSGYLLTDPAAVLVKMRSEGLSSASEADVSTILGIMALTLVSIGLVFAFLRNLGLVINSVGAGDPFAPVNALRLARMGWFMVALQLVSLPMAALATGVMEQVDSVKFSPGISGQGIVLALVLFILARVFRHGAAMRDDLEGTV